MSPFAKLAAASPKPTSSSPPTESFSGFSSFASKPSPFLTHTKSTTPTPPVSRATASTPKAGEAFGSFSKSAIKFNATKPDADEESDGSTTKSNSAFGDILADKGIDNEVEKTKFEQKDAADCE